MIKPYMNKVVITEDVSMVMCAIRANVIMARYCVGNVAKPKNYTTLM